MEDKNQHVSQSHYHGCWWLGDRRNQGISSIGIDLICMDISVARMGRVMYPVEVNALARGSSFKNAIFKLINQNSSWGTQCKIALRWIPQNLINDESTLVQMMAWCHQVLSNIAVYSINCHFSWFYWCNLLSHYNASLFLQNTSAIVWEVNVWKQDPNVLSALSKNLTLTCWIFSKKLKIYMGQVTKLWLFFLPGFAINW